MVRNENTRRRFGTTLVLWGLVLGLILVLPFLHGPVRVASDGGTGSNLVAIDVDWRFVVPTLAVVFAAGFLLRSASHRCPQCDARTERGESL